MVRRSHIPFLVVATLLAAGCSAGTVRTPALSAPPSVPPSVVPTSTAPTHSATASPEPGQQVRPRPVAAALVAYGSCARLRQSVRREAMAEVTSYGLRFGMYGGRGPGLIAAPAPMAGASGTAMGAAPAAPAAAFSATNNQEDGVDEPDLVKTDGHLMLIVRQGRPSVQVIDVSGAKPRLRGTLRLGSDNWDTKLFLLGHTAIVLGTEAVRDRTVTTVRVVELSDPDHPHVVRTFRAEGGLVDARLLKGRVVLAVQDVPHVTFAYPSSASRAELHRALLVNRRLLAAVTAEDWLPTVTVQPGGSTHRTGCAQTLHPGVPSGLGITSLLSIDPATSAPPQTLTVVGTSSTLYASTDRLYLATTSWDTMTRQSGALPSDTTALHGFDLSDPDHVTFMGSGSVPGTLLDQYALSSYEGDLRVATTVGTGTPPPGEGKVPAALSDSRVTVLRPEGGALVPVGKVTGLGRGERIYGVRFVGRLGYVVTFRQTDPLYVVDLSDPVNPRLRGELELTGYSSTLYPLDGNRMLGVGQAVDAQARQVGLQLSVFDTARPDAPRLSDKTVLQGAYSSAEQDHHALLWWEPSRLLVMPVSQYDAQQFDGAIVFRVGTDGSLAEAWRIARPTSNGVPVIPERTVVVGGLLYSVTDTGVITNRIDRLDEQAWLPFT
jgi:uncharacterized secreted protein with C-terminal beta-propeller domain